MKSIPFLLDELSGRGIFLSEANGAVTYRAPAGALTENDKRTIRDRKGEFLTYLRARGAADGGPWNVRQEACRPSFYQEVWFNWFKDVPIALPFERVHLVRNFSGISAARAAAAVAKIVGRHDALRMNLRETPEGLFAGVQAAEHFRAEMHELDDEAGLAPLLQQFFSQSPRALEAWLTRACIAGLPGGNSVIAIAMHHMVCDAESYRLIAAELDAETAEPGVLPPLASPSYQDFVAAERNWFKDGRRAALSAYWSEWIGRIPRLTSPQQKHPLVWLAGERIKAQTFLGEDIARHLTRVAGALRTSPFILVLTGFILALKEWSGQNHFAVRSVADGRTHASLGTTVGLILRHYLVEANVPTSWELAGLVKAVACEYESGVELRCPTHWEHSGADFRTLHLPIAPTLNYVAVPSPYRDMPGPMSLPPGAQPRAIIWKAPEPWPAWLPPIQFRVLHFTDRIVLAFEFNGALLDEGEQRSLIESYLRVTDMIVAGAA